MTGNADVCMICEGTYPYMPGGVSSWVHDLIRTQRDFTFHIVSVLTDARPMERRYCLPENVVGLSHVYLQQLDSGPRPRPALAATLSALEPTLLAVQRGCATQSHLASMLYALRTAGQGHGRRGLLNSEAAFALLTRMYERLLPAGSFLNYFWSWRSLMSGLFGTLLTPIPTARTYHAISTGYAGLFAARARLETGRPMVVTEHGIYTNERRIELTLADWVRDGAPGRPCLQHDALDLADIWHLTFKSYASMCYEAATSILTLCSSNRVLQEKEGADPRKIAVIPNGIDIERFAALRRPRGVFAERPTIALIGRVAPIKDIKTFIQACVYIRAEVPTLHALVLGGTDEDPGYFEECKELVIHLGLSATVEFLGQVRIEEYLPRIDVVVLTSLSEVQPLTILEAGAAGVPVVATDVGACREMILGASNEHPPLGHGGAIVPVASPASIGDSIVRLLQDPDTRWAKGDALFQRVVTHYTQARMSDSYRKRYNDLCEMPDLPVNWAKEDA